MCEIQLKHSDDASIKGIIYFLLIRAYRTHKNIENTISIGSNISALYVGVPTTVV